MAITLFIYLINVLVYLIYIILWICKYYNYENSSMWTRNVCWQDVLSFNWRKVIFTPYYEEINESADAFIAYWHGDVLNQRSIKDEKLEAAWD